MDEAWTPADLIAGAMALILTVVVLVVTALYHPLSFMALMACLVGAGIFGLVAWWRDNGDDR